jgi:hypothetical protein
VCSVGNFDWKVGAEKNLACSVKNLDWQVGAASKFWSAASGIWTGGLVQESFAVQRQEF